MNDPTRWRTDTTRRPLEAGVILRGARRPRGPADGELARLDAVVADIPRRAAAHARRWTRLASAAAAGITLLALGTGVWAWRGLRAPAAPATRPIVLAARTPALAVPVPDDASEQAPVDETTLLAPHRPRRAVAHAARRERPARPPHPVAAAPVDMLARETALIDAARDRLATAPGQALARLNAHRRDFPNGQLAAEREFLAIESLRRMGRADEARARAASLAERFPQSSYAARAERLLR